MATTTQRIVSILVYADTAVAHDFLVDTFGLESGGVHRSKDGEVTHGEVALAGEVIWLHRASPDYRLRGVAELSAATGMLNLFVPTSTPTMPTPPQLAQRSPSRQLTSPAVSASMACTTQRGASGPSPHAADPTRSGLCAIADVLQIDPTTRRARSDIAEQSSLVVQ